MKARDFIGVPCECPPCRQAGMSDRPTRRDPRTGAMLHGQDLRRWYEARDSFMQLARASVGPRGRHASGFERLAQAPARESEQNR